MRARPLLDRFGRVRETSWYDTNDDEYRVRLQYGYDEVGNRKWRADLIAGSTHRDELYAYDGLYQLVDMQRGQLNATKDGFVTSPANTKNFAEQWTLQPLGNWSNFKQDAAGDGTFELDQNRTHNAANEMTAASSWTTPVHDNAGNMTRAPKPADLTNADGYALTYDAWNRLVKVQQTVESVLRTVAEYQYDGRNFRTVKKSFDANGTLSETRHFFYNANWQVLEERLESGGTMATTANRQYIWGERYVDDLVLRDDDSDNDGVEGDGNLGKANSGLDRRLYALQDANWNVVALTADGDTMSERYNYTAYGRPAFMADDFSSRASSSYAWDYLYTGRQYDPETGFYYYRNRPYHANLGRFISRDPIGYKGGINLYEYVGDNPLARTDSTGLGNLNVWRWIAYNKTLRVLEAARKSGDGCECTVKKLLDAAANFHVFPQIDHCHKWADRFLEQNRNKYPCCFLRKAEWHYSAYDYPPLNCTPIGEPLGHGAVSVMLRNGTVFYLDDGWWGGIFFEEDIPPWMIRDR